MRNFARLGLAMAMLLVCSGLVQAQCGNGPFSRCAMRQAAVVSAPQGVPVQATVVQHHVFHQPTVAQAYIPASTGCGCQCSQAAVNVTVHQPATPVRTVAHAGVHYAGNVVQAAVQPMGAFLSSDNAIAQRKAQQQAAEGRMRHVGGSLGSGGYEGVGFSTRSAEDAVRNCCYWGQRTPTAVAVSRGPNGWYANVLYR